MTTIAFFNNVHSSAIWYRLADPLKRHGVTLTVFGYGSQDELCMRIRNGEIDIIVTDISGDMPGFEDLYGIVSSVKVRVGLNPRLPKDFSTFTDPELGEIREYFAVLSKENFLNGLKRITGIDHDPCRPVVSHGIYHPDAPRVFYEVKDYKEWLQSRRSWDENFPVAAIIMHYSHVAEGSCADIDALIAGLEGRGVLALCVFSDTISETRREPETRYPWYRYFSEPDIRPDVILNFLMGRLFASIEERSLLREINVPVVQLLRHYTLSPEAWLEDPVGLSAMSLTHSLVQPEMFGVIDPIMVSGSIRKSGEPAALVTSVPIMERIDMVARRVRRWAALRRKSNKEKRIAIVLHNNPCKGVENTVGMAVGLDTFESLILLLHRMQETGYEVGEIPGTGKELLDMIQERKALSEFRWTTADEIVKKGGVLHAMDHDEYGAFFGTLDSFVRQKVEADWGAFPGQGMVWKKSGKEALLITGLRFGNILVMTQPKRGCYGSRCDGEVCRILHDPEIAPPHHWLATYFYIQRHTDAVIHFGASGALEYLPGKRAVLSDRCFGDISLGDLPNFYPYVMDVPGEGMVAKRRGRAVIIDHLTPAYRPAEMSGDLLQFEDLLTEYRRAGDGNDRVRQQSLLKSIEEVAVKLKFLDEYDGAEKLEESIERFSRQITRIRRSMVPDGMHVFGRKPGISSISAMVTSALDRSGSSLPSVAELAAMHPAKDGEVFDRAAGIVQAIVSVENGSAEVGGLVAELPGHLKQWCRDMADAIAMAEQESCSLLRALDGEYVDASLAGSLSSGKQDVLPTGRNFYAADIMSMPSEAAWYVGKKLADQLLEKFYREEGRFPESIGLSLWSSDAFKSDGEMLSQIFWLMGVEPVRQPNGRVSGVAVVDLDQLRLVIDNVEMLRPRIDATIETSGIVRDMVPHFISLLDKAVAMVSRIDEPAERNMVRKHTRQQLEELKREAADLLSEKEMQRMAMFRVFSSAPGTYSSGVGLALDASAWQNEHDLAEAYVNQSGYAYGSMPQDFGRKAHELLARQLSKVEVSYIKQTSAEYDALDCDCYASYAGGMAAASTALSGKKTKMYWADTTVPRDIDIRDFKEEIERSVRSKLLNDRWISSMKDHGFQGAQGVAGRINTLFKWSATTREVEPWVFDSVVETYVCNEELREWMREQNPYALEEITRRLLEAEARGLWNADEELLEAVRSAALLLEGDLEERIGDVAEDFQGARVDVFTSKEVEKWKMEWKMSGKKEGPS